MCITMPRMGITLYIVTITRKELRGVTEE